MKNRNLPTNTKKIILIIVTIVVLALVIGIHLIHNNHRYGMELYRTTCTMSVQAYELADAIAYLQEAFANPDIENDDIYTHPFDSAILETRSYFGYEDMPLLQDVWSGYTSRIEKLWRLVAGKDVDELEKLFTKEADELADFKYHLDNLTKQFDDFREKYNQMSKWERYFVSWRKEQKILNEKVRIP